MRLPDLNDLIQDLQLAKEISIKNEMPNSLISAVMAQAKLLGLDSGEQISNEPQPIKVVIQTVDARKRG